MNKNEKNNCHYRDCEAMTFHTLTLALVLAMGIISESRAAEVETPFCKNTHGGVVTCIEKLADKNGNNSCGDNCTYKVIEENGKQVLHVYKEDISKPATIRDGAFSPKFYAGNQVLDATGNALPLNNIVLDNDFENIRSYAFAESGAQISSASGKFIVNKTGIYAFYYGSKRTTMNADVIFNNEGHYVLEGADINGDVIISDGVTEMGIYALGATRIDGNIIIPQSVEKIRLDSLLLYSLTGQIYCASGIENCYNMIIAGCSEKEGRTEWFNSAKNLLDSKKFSAYPDGCLKLGAGLECTKCANNNFKLSDGVCRRVRYTPAEAAEVAGETNTIFLYYK